MSDDFDFTSDQEAIIDAIDAGEEFDEARTKEAIATGLSADFLLYCADKRFETRWKRMNNTMIKFLEDVQKHFPDAQYYTASGGFNLMLGASHDCTDRRLKGQQELIALTGNASVGDGDF